MIRIVCDICRKELPAETPIQPPHLCERCAPFAGDFYQRLAEFMVKQAETFRARYLQQTVIKSPKLEAVK